MDWASITLSFIFAALPTFFIVGLVTWKYSPYTSGTTILLIASIAALLVGLIASIWRSRFWETTSNIGSHTPYARKKNNG